MLLTRALRVKFSIIWPEPCFCVISRLFASLLCTVVGFAWQATSTDTLHHLLRLWLIGIQAVAIEAWLIADSRVIDGVISSSLLALVNVEIWSH